MIMKLLLSILLIALCVVGIVTPFAIALPVWFQWIVAMGCFAIMLCAIQAIVKLVE